MGRYGSILHKMMVISCLNLSTGPENGKKVWANAESAVFRKNPAVFGQETLFSKPRQWYNFFMDTLNDTIRYLRAQCARYPALEIQDLLKALHQSVYGCGHFVAPQAAGLLEQEWAALPPDAASDVEPLDGDFCRLHLGYAVQNGLSAETLLRIFTLSAESPAGSEPELREKLAVLLDPAVRLPFSHQELSAAVERWRAEGFPACHHSRAFRAAYHPAYRVIRREFVPLLPLLTAIDRALAEQDQVILAIEGGSASGKTTLAALLARIYDSTVFHADDFFLRPEQRTPARLAEPGGNMDRERLLKEVLLPLAQGQPAVFRRYDCHTQTLLEPTTISPKALNIVEGAYSMHPLLEKYYDLSVFLRISPELQRARILRRNGPEVAERFFSTWVPLEQLYFDALRPQEHCDLLLDADHFSR